MRNVFRELAKSIFIGCAIFCVLLSIRLLQGDALQAGRDLAVNFGYTLLYAVVIYTANAALFIALNRIFGKNSFSVKRLVIGFVLSFMISVACVVLLRIFEDVVVRGRSWQEYLSAERPANYVTAMIITFVVALAIHAFYFYRKIQEDKVREQKIIAGTASAQFESLKNQIDPHFLFNSLNVLSSLIEENPDNAQKFTSSLSKVYRYVLEQKDKEVVPVSEELDFARTYLGLLKMRFENSLVCELPGSFPEDGRVVPLSLQLLLENTIKHNVVSESRPLHIRIYFEEDYLVVENGLQKKEILRDREGVGLQNIASRYAIITRRKIMAGEENGHFSVRIPVLTKKIQVMETSYANEQSAFLRAQKRMEDIKGFYGNLMAYIIVNIGLAILNFTTSPEYWWFLYPAMGWGVGLAVHGMAVFNAVPFLGKDWESRKIQEIIEREKSSKWN